jgi:hypothetical protein
MTKQKRQKEIQTFLDGVAAELAQDTSQGGFLSDPAERYAQRVGDSLETLRKDFVATVAKLNERVAKLEATVKELNGETKNHST